MYSFVTLSLDQIRLLLCCCCFTAAQPLCITGFVYPSTTSPPSDCITIPPNPTTQILPQNHALSKPDYLERFTSWSLTLYIVGQGNEFGCLPRTSENWLHSVLLFQLREWLFLTLSPVLEKLLLTSSRFPLLFSNLLCFNFDLFPHKR